MNIFNIDEFPYVEFGSIIKRKVRLIVSPYTNIDKNITVVHVSIPPKGISEGHTHPDCTEFIYFDNNGLAIIDGKEFPVKKNSVVYAPQGSMHECRNISETEILNLLCIFVPTFKPYGCYPELIEKTKQYIEGIESISNETV